MKSKLIIFKYSFLLLFLSTKLNAQILNGDFEAWTSNMNPDNLISNPDNWISNNAYVYTVITKSTDKHSGQYAVKGEVVNFDSSSVPPMLYGGTKGEGFSVSQRYAFLNGYYKFSSVGSDVFTASLVMYNDNSPIAAKDTILAPSSEYAQFSIPIEYFNSDTPNKFTIQFKIQDPTDTIPANVGSYFLLDDVQLTGDAATGVKDIASIPERFQVYQNYPNPFNPSTTIRYSIPKANNVMVNIYDINGSLVNALVNQRQNAGTYEVKWDGKNSSGTAVVSGVYLYRVNAGNYSKVSKMILLK